MGNILAHGVSYLKQNYTIIHYCRTWQFELSYTINVLFIKIVGFKLMVNIKTTHWWTSKANKNGGDGKRNFCIHWYVCRTNKNPPWLLESNRMELTGAVNDISLTVTPKIKWVYIIG